MNISCAAAFFLRMVSAAYAIIALVAFCALVIDSGSLGIAAQYMGWYAVVLPVGLFGAGLWGWIGLVVVSAAVCALGFLGARWLENGDERGQLAWRYLLAAAWIAAITNFVSAARPLFGPTLYEKELLIESLSVFREAGLPSAIVALVWAGLYTVAYRLLNRRSPAS